MYKKLQKFAVQLVNELPKIKLYLVGGSVRDSILSGDNFQFNHPSIKDLDIEIYNVQPAQFIAALDKLGVKYDLVGQSFGVYKVTLAGDGETFDFAFPRREVKTGVGYKGFTIEVDPFMSLEEAVQRRDLTINGLMWDILAERLIDLVWGIEDIHRGQLRAVSEKFNEDPLRVLRVFQFAARFGFTASMGLTDRCYSLLKEKNTLVKERVWGEWEKWCTKSLNPSMGIEFLKECLWLDDEIADLFGVQQDPIYHPEGDAYVHTLHVIESANCIRVREHLSKDDSIVLMLSALCHDFGKVLTTKWDGERWVSPNHANVGVVFTQNFLEKIGCPLKYRKAICTLVAEHMTHLNFSEMYLNPRGVRRLINRLVDGETNLRMLGHLVEADHSGRPPLAGGMPETMENIFDMAAQLQLDGESKIAPEITGDELIALGFKEGKELGDVLKKLYQKQLDGENVRRKYLQILLDDLLICHDDFRGYVSRILDDGFKLRGSDVQMDYSNIDWPFTIKERLKQ